MAVIPMPFFYINVGHYMSYVGSRFQEFYAEKWCAMKSKNLPSTFPTVTVTSTHQVMNLRAV